MRMTDSGIEPAADPTGPSGTEAGEISTEVAVPAVPFGEWPSPITAAAVASGQVRVSSPIVLGNDVWWQQGLPNEGGRTTVMHSAGGTQTALLAAPWNARTRVHEYGGRSYLPIPRAALAGLADQEGTGGAADDAASAEGGYQILFANYSDQRLYLTGPGDAEPAPLTPDPAGTPAGSGVSGAGRRR